MMILPEMLENVCQLVKAQKTGLGQQERMYLPKPSQMFKIELT